MFKKKQPKEPAIKITETRDISMKLDSVDNITISYSSRNERLGHYTISRPLDPYSVYDHREIWVNESDIDPFIDSLLKLKQRVATTSLPRSE